MMKITAFVLALLAGVQIITAQSSQFQYLSPLPNSKLNSKQTSIIIRDGRLLDAASIKDAVVSVKGSLSGMHQGKLILSDDKKTVIFKPLKEFTPDEMVYVNLSNGIKTQAGKNISTLDWSFKVSPLQNQIMIESNEEYPAASPDLSNEYSIQQTDSLPADFPVFTVSNVNNPSDDKIFIANKPAQSKLPFGNYIMIADNNGNVLKYKKFSVAESNFKVLPNGLLAVSDAGRHFVMDTTLAILDTFTCGNGYKTDVHDFLLLPNGHAIVFGTDPQPVDMSLIVPGGRTDATVIGNVIQELDADKNVIFQWRSWDYIPFTSSYYDLTAKSIDYVHVNAFVADDDGNLIVTMRLASNVIKIDRNTGEIIWILGGKDNQFTFINEHESNAPDYFSYPHNATLLPNGNLTLFDNGDLHSPPYSRGVEYEIDEHNKTVKLVWEFRHSPDIYASSGGNMQRLPDGNSIICWGRGGSSDGNPVFTEVHPDGSVALELFYPNGEFSYRAYKFPFNNQAANPRVTAYDILNGNTYSFNNDTAKTGITITFDQLNAEQYANAIVTKYNYSPSNPDFIQNAPTIFPHYIKFEGELIYSFNGEVHVDLSKYPSITKPEQTIAYGRSMFAEFFAALPTSYNAASNELIFTTTDFGEFTFGIPQALEINEPFPVSPRNHEIVNGEKPVTFIWGTRGIVQWYTLQVAADSLFSNPVIIEPGLSSHSIIINSLSNNMDYYWRINTTNLSGTSGWSAVSSFSTRPPYIKVAYPDGGNDLYLDSTYVIRWQSNLSDTVNIELVKDNNTILVIADTVVSATKALYWKVPSDIQKDTSYGIKIYSLGNPTLSDVSDDLFSIRDKVTGVNDELKITSYSLFQNYPNPFNPETWIEFQLPIHQHVSLKIFDILGKEVANIISQELPAGRYKYPWNAENFGAGVYLYRLQAGDYNETRKLILLK